MLDTVAQIFSKNGTHPGMVDSRGRLTPTPRFVGWFIFFDLQLAPGKGFSTLEGCFFFFHFAERFFFAPKTGVCWNGFMTSYPP